MRRFKSKSLSFESLEVKRLLAADGAEIIRDSYQVEQNSRDLTFDVLSNDEFDSDYAGAKVITEVSLGSIGGRISIAEDGKSIDYSPPADYSGPESFTYFVDTDHSATVSVRINAPLRDDAFRFVPDRDTYELDVMTNDPFWEGYTGPRNITLVSASSNGSQVEISEDGKSLAYTRAEHTYGRDTLTYIVDDKYPATATVDVSNPLSFDEFQLVQFDPSATYDLLRNDPFFEGYEGERKITHILDAAEDVGVAIAGDGAITFDPQEAKYGNYRLRYVVDSEFEGTVNFRVERPVNDDYITVDANSDSFAVFPLGNDYFYRMNSSQRIFHVDNITEVTQSEQGGSVTLSADGKSIRYTPSEDFVGQDKFTYTADGQHVATVTVNVRDPLGDGSFRNDWLTVYKGTVGNELAVLENDFAGNGYTGDRIITSVEAIDGADLEIARDGKSLLFTPTDDSLNNFTFNYTVDDLLTASVRVHADSISQYESFQFSTPGTQTLSIVSGLEIPSNYGGDAVITSITEPNNGSSAIISADGKSVTVELGVGEGSFEYTIDDKYTSTVRTSYHRRLNSDYFAVHMNSDATALDVLENDFDTYSEDRYGRYRGDKLITGVSSSEDGTVQISADGKNITFEPNADFIGNTTLSYVVDGYLESTIDVDVARLLRHDRVHTDPDSSDNVLNVLGNDLVGGEYSGGLVITNVSSGSNGAAISIAEDGKSVVYSPASGFVGTDVFEYTVDGQLKANVTVEVNATASDLYTRFDSMDSFKELVLGTSAGNNFFFVDGGDFALEDSTTLSAVQRDHSETNVQVEGVDEADLIETDSDYIYTLTQGHLVITKAWPADQMEVMSTTLVDGSPVGQYLYGDRLTVISTESKPIVPDGEEVSDRIWYPTEQLTNITVLDVTDRANPKLVQRTEIEGSHVQTRRIDDFVYAVVRDPQSLAVGLEYICEDENESVCRYETTEERDIRIEENFAEVVEDLLPNYESYGPDGKLVRSGLLIQPEDIFDPISEGASSLVSVAAINVTNNEPGLASATGVLTTGASELYVTADDLYVFENHYSWQVSDNETLDDSPSTKILKFELDGDTGGIEFAATGQVPGSMLNQFSADEYDGHLRVATSVSNWRTGNYSQTTENALFVLKDDGGILEHVGTMQNLALNESIQSVRFFGDRAMVTTFQNVDPLFSVNLSDHESPQVEGYLTLPGFSSYMQFVAEDKVLTIGRSTGGAGAGVTMISLFDVSNFLQPVLVDQFNWGSFSSSVAETDHHAFGWFGNHSTLAIPSVEGSWQRFDKDNDGYNEFREYVSEYSLHAFDVDTTISTRTDEAIVLKGAVEMSSPLLRSAYIDDKLYAVAEDSIVSTNIASPNDVIAEVSIKPPEIEQTEPEIDFRLRVMDGLRLEARRDLATAAGVSESQVMLVATEADVDDTSILMRVGDERFVYQGVGDQLVLKRSDYRASAATALDWHNDDVPLDTNGDGEVSAIDALVIINMINAGNDVDLPVGTVLNQIEQPNSRFKVDVNGDGSVTAIDALRIVNHLNAQVAEEASAEPMRTAVAVDAVLASTFVAEDDDDDDETTS